MSADDQQYYRGRALDERVRAEQATSPQAAAIHKALAERYEERANATVTQLQA